MVSYGNTQTQTTFVHLLMSLTGTGHYINKYLKKRDSHGSWIYNYLYNQWLSPSCEFKPNSGKVYSIQHYVILNHRSKRNPLHLNSFPFYIYVNTLFFSFLLLINCKYMVCSRRCIVVTIDGASYDVDVDNKVCQWLATGLWFSPGTTVFSTNKTNQHDKHHKPNHQYKNP
jgi:hypothetical protein